jgi:hypothetical protein
MGQKGVPPKAPLLDHRARLSQPEQAKSPPKENPSPDDPVLPAQQLASALLRREL